MKYADKSLTAAKFFTCRSREFHQFRRLCRQGPDDECASHSAATVMQSNFPFVTRRDYSGETIACRNSPKKTRGFSGSISRRRWAIGVPVRLLRWGFVFLIARSGLG